MSRIERVVESMILGAASANKVLLLFGTRRVGKTFLLQMILKKYQRKYVLLNGEDITVQEMFQNRSVLNLKNITGDASLLAIDEAQAIPDIGKALKLMIDTQPDLTILATGSSSLDLSNSSGEPLTGRQIPFFLYPIAQMELKQHAVEARQHLDERLIYGSYPEIFQMKSHEDKAMYLQQLVQSYLLKDILSFSGIRHSGKIFSLLRMVAFQVGSEVSYQEDYGRELSGSVE